MEMTQKEQKPKHTARSSRAAAASLLLLLQPHCCCPTIAAASLLLPHCCVPFLLLLLLLLPHCCCFCCYLIGIICLRFFHNMICIICKSHFLYSAFTRMCYTILKCFKNRSFCCYMFYDVQPFFKSFAPQLFAFPLFADLFVCI